MLVIWEMMLDAVEGDGGALGDDVGAPRGGVVALGDDVGAMGGDVGALGDDVGCSGGRWRCSVK